MKDQWGAFCTEIGLEPTQSGALDGLAFAVKDVFDIEGYVPGAGSPDWKRTHAPARRNAAAVDMLLRSGARLAGMTNTDELMFSLNGENYHFGTPINPQAERHIPGGSSSGSAVAVSAGLVDFALGTDTGGSVRIPASYCGVYGFRPTYGAVPVDGVVPLAPSFDTIGWFARDPRVLCEVGRALVGTGDRAVDAPIRRIVIGKDLLAVMAPECREQVEPLIRRIAAFTESYREAEIAVDGLAEWMRVFRILQGSDVWRTHHQWIERVQPRFGPGVAERFAWSRTLKDRDIRQEQSARADIRRRLIDLLGDDGLIVLPTAPGPAPLRNTTGEKLEDWRGKTLQLCCIAGLGGLPQVTLPWARIGGLPIGLSVIAGPGRDVPLLQWVRHIARDLRAAQTIQT